MAYSMDIRRRVIKALDHGESVESIAQRLEIGVRTVYDYRRRNEAGRLEPDKTGPQNPTKLTEADYRTLQSAIATRPDITLRELAKMMSKPVVESTIHRALKKLKLTLKKKSLIAAEQQRMDVMFRRGYFAIARRFVEPDQFVFLDESGAKTNMTRLYGRAPKGKRCRFSVAHGNWKTTTMLSAIRSTGVIESASVVFAGATDATIFRDYVNRMLAPSLRPGDIVVMDNLPAHKVAGVVESIEAVDATVWFLPPYSPDLNPIEKMWSKVKGILRRVAARTTNGLVTAIGDALRAVSPDECKNYLRSCGYC